MNLATATDAELLTATFASLTFQDQKNGVRGEAKVAVSSSVLVAVARCMRRAPRKSWTSQSWKGDESDGLWAYSSGRSKKKNAMPIISARHWCWGS